MEPLSLHEACYQGKVEDVASLLAAGADPNAPAEATGRKWISCAEGAPRPLNCVAIAWGMTERHLRIASLLIEHGARVDETMIKDHQVEMAGSALDLSFQRLLAENI
ncbi:MAG: hypothetical protein AB8H86_21105 [Polyangiales bacterium]